MRALRRILRRDRGDLPLDAPELVEVHRGAIRQKPFLRRFYDDAYDFFVAERTGLPPGTELELGSGGGYLKERIPTLQTSEVLAVAEVDRHVDATALDDKDLSMAAIYLLDVFHHIQDVEAFLREAHRCLRPGGKVVMIEPANTLFGRFVYRRFHHEPFEPGAASWRLPAGGPMSMANGALPWIVFTRDRDRFAQLFSGFEIARQQPFGPLLYLLSGGVSMRQLLPSFMLPVVRGVEWLLRPFDRWLGMFQRIVIVKR